MSDDYDIMGLVGCKDAKSLDKYLLRIGSLESNRRNIDKKASDK
jgi:hypothetical protein